MTEQQLTRKCTKCGREFPRTAEFFEKSKLMSDGLRPDCRECRRIYKRQWQRANPDKIREYHRRSEEKNAPAHRQAELRWLRDNPEKAKEKRRRYYARHKHHVLAHNHGNRALKYGAKGTLTGADMERIFALQKGRCLYCNKELEKNYHTDHFIPLCEGGQNIPSNIALVCPNCNRKKNKRLPQNWEGWNGAFPVEWNL